MLTIESLKVSQNRLSQFYEQSLPSMYQCISQIEDEDLSYSLVMKMNIARVNLLSVAKTTMTHRLNSIISNQYECYVQNKYDQSSKKCLSISDFNQAMSQTEEYLTVLSECLNCPRFMVDLYSRYPIDCDLKRLNQARPDILYPF